MRASIIIAVILAMAIIGGGIFWFNTTQTDRATFEQEQTERIGEIGQDHDDAATEQEEPATPEAEPVGAPDIVSDGGEPLQSGEATLPTGAEQLLTPDQFDPEAYLDLIDASAQLAAEDQSRLRALVEGASVNSAMIEGTVNAIRVALGLPPLT